MLLGAYLLFSIASAVSTDPVIALGGATLLSFVIGLLVYLALMRWTTGKSVLAAILLTIALGIPYVA